jgi:tetratricopeptide (TPR) repeat protein
MKKKLLVFVNVLGMAALIAVITGCATTGRQSAREYYDQGVEAYNKKDWDTAITYFTWAIEENSDYKEAYNQRGWAYLRTGKSKWAEDDFNEALRVDPVYGNAKNGLRHVHVPHAAYLLWEEGRDASNAKNYDLAIEKYSQAIALAPDYTSAYSNRAVVYYNNKKMYDEAEADLKEVVRLDPEDANAHANLGVVYKERGNYDTAKQYLDRALEIEPGYTFAQNELKDVNAKIAAAEAAARAAAAAKAAADAWAALPKYYVSARGNDNNDGRTEARAFKTLAKAVSAASGSSIKTVAVIGTLNQASENDDDEADVFSITNISNTPILISGAPNAPSGSRAVLSAAGTQKNCVNIVWGTFRFENIEISGSPKTGLVVSIGVEDLTSDVTLGPGSVVRNNQGGGVSVIGPKAEYRSIIKPGTLTLDGGIVENNRRAMVGGGIFVTGIFTMKRGSVRNNTAVFSSNEASMGGGIYIETSDPVSITGGDISGNTASIGGGIGISGGRVTMTGGSISGNTGITGAGGVVVNEGAVFTQRSGTVSGNKAPRYADIFRMQ